MIDVKALLNKLMEKVNTYKFSSSSPVSTLTSQFNFEYRANLAFNKWSDFYYCVGMPNNSRIKSFVYSGSYPVTGSTSKCHVIKEYLPNGTSGSTSLVGTYTIFSGYLFLYSRQIASLLSGLPSSPGTESSRCRCPGRWPCGRTPSGPGKYGNIPADSCRDSPGGSPPPGRNS